MWLRVPDTSPGILWEGELEPDPEVAEGQQRGWPGGGEETSDLRELPVVSIGRPEVWPLRELGPVEQLPALLQASLAQDDFHLVRLACSFRPKRQELQVEWARFGVSLWPDAQGRQPVAHDMHPMHQVNEVKRNVKVSLSPKVKFQEIEAEVGGADFGFEYTEIQPMVSAAGIGEAEPSWDFQAVTGVRLFGSRWMHLLVRAPRDMTTAEASLGLVADVVRGGMRLPLIARTGREVADPLKVRLW